MNRKVKRSLIISAVVLVICIGVMAIIGARFQKEMKRFQTLETAQLLPSVYAVKSDIANLFLLPDTGGAFIAIDAGTDSNLILQGLSTLRIDPAKISAVLCTHSDDDHIGGLAAFTKAKVIISEAEKQMVDGRTARAIGIMRNHLSVPYSTVADGAEFFAGTHRVKATLTPGHTPGSICWQVDDSLLFSGDAFGIENGKAGLFSKLFNMNTEQQIKSIANISHLPNLKHVFTSHNGQNDNPTELFGQ